MAPVESRRRQDEKRNYSRRTCTSLQRAFKSHLVETPPGVYRNRPTCTDETGQRKEIEHRCGGGFWKLSDIPENAKPFKALSNGSIVNCFFLNNGETIHIYRPNPNAKEVYKPLALKERIKFVKNNYLC